MSQWLPRNDFYLINGGVVTEFQHNGSRYVVCLPERRYEAIVASLKNNCLKTWREVMLMTQKQHNSAIFPFKCYECGDNLFADAYERIQVEDQSLVIPEAYCCHNCGGLWTWEEFWKTHLQGVVPADPSFSDMVARNNYIGTVPLVIFQKYFPVEHKQYLAKRDKMSERK